MRTDTQTLASALDVLAREIQSGDGVANAAITEAAERLRELEKALDRLGGKYAVTGECGIRDVETRRYADAANAAHLRDKESPNA